MKPAWAPDPAKPKARPSEGQLLLMNKLIDAKKALNDVERKQIELEEFMLINNTKIAELLKLIAKLEADIEKLQG